MSVCSFCGARMEPSSEKNITLNFSVKPEVMLMPYKENFMEYLEMTYFTAGLRGPSKGEEIRTPLSFGGWGRHIRSSLGPPVLVKVSLVLGLKKVDWKCSVNKRLSLIW